MKKLKEIFSFIKEKYKNPRTRAALILGLYLILFIYLFIGLAGVDTASSTDNEQIQNYTYINENYNYNYNIEITKNSNTNKYLFTGTNVNGIENQKVELYNHITKNYEEIFDYDDINPKFTDLNTIISYVNNLKEEFTTNYKDGTVQKNYLVELNKIDSNIDSNETIEINIYEKENFITKIIIDGTNFDSKTNNNVSYSKYILEYSEIIIEKNNE